MLQKVLDKDQVWHSYVSKEHNRLTEEKNREEEAAFPILKINDLYHSPESLKVLFFLPIARMLIVKPLPPPFMTKDFQNNAFVVGMYTIQTWTCKTGLNLPKF